MKIAQSQDYQGDDWWTWAIWIDCTPEELAQISEVTYTLHPTYSEPVRRVTDPSGSFRVESRGWGTFPIHAEVKFRDGRSVKLRHELELYYPETDKKAPVKIAFNRTDAIGRLQIGRLVESIKSVAPKSGVAIFGSTDASSEVRSDLTLELNLTGPGVAALLDGIQGYLVRDPSASLDLITPSGKIVALDSKNAVSELSSTMSEMREQNPPRQAPA